MRGRYAPSPTGALHLGNLRTALLAWLFARASGGSFILRIEDLDLPRVRPGATAQLLDDLRWLGLNWDEGPDVGGPLGPYYQSQRGALYGAALGRLHARGALYPCYCTRAELARLASAPHDNGRAAARYPGTCRHLSARERRAHEASGRRPAWRFRAPRTPVAFHDAIAGAVSERVAATIGDFVVCRSDGVVAYQLAVVVDDALMGVTQVVRGHDLLASTARQLALYDALAWPRPADYAHVPLALDERGNRLAKRDAPHGLARARAAGMAPERVVAALAATCGLGHRDVPMSPADLLADFRPEHVTREPSRIAL
ncbi:MAG TPA: tRNA glutamyl-Q(34) synthetase GluQRS [Ktedonobacterales bacterium]|nr:tRNA glutamyl-Q(34) synthetase GluQRS [Ktedonobacterales bacterium]